VQYALQRRHDERAGKAPPFVVMIMARVLAASGASSLLDRTEQEWRAEFGKKRSNASALLAWSRRQVADLAEGTGWDAEYPRDAWQMHRLGFEGGRVLDFSGIPQPQLRGLAGGRPGQQLHLPAGALPMAGALRRPRRARPPCAPDPHQWRHILGTRLKMGRIAFGASFGSSREHALPAAQDAALRCPGLPGAPRGRDDLGLHDPPGSDATMMRLIPLRGVHHNCTCWHRDASGSSQLHRVHHRRSG
jgi:hypothetical protein